VCATTIIAQCFTMDFNYRGWDLLDAIDALMAYDHAATDSGVKDEDLREAVRSYLESLDWDERGRVLSRFAARYFTREVVESGTLLDEVKQFIEWLDEVGIST
jgi:hypothetical protein